MIDSKSTTDIDAPVVGAGQAGLAAGWPSGRPGLSFMIVDNLARFSPARFSALRGLRLPDGPAATRGGTTWLATSATPRPSPWPPRPAASPSPGVPDIEISQWTTTDGVAGAADRVRAKPH
jgi:hypothetical protein